MPITSIRNSESPSSSESCGMSPDSSEGIDERKFVVALARGLEMLRAFRPGETLLGNRDFVDRTGLPQAPVNRLAYTLTTLGYLRFDEPAGKYALDTGVLSLGFALLAGADALELAGPPMRVLGREIRGALTLGLAPGSRLSMLTSSMGRAYLAVQEPDQRAALLEELGAAAVKNGEDGARLGEAAQGAVDR